MAWRGVKPVLGPPPCGQRETGFAIRIRRSRILLSAIGDGFQAEEFCTKMPASSTDAMIDRLGDTASV
jgi:hypothetical protein